MSEYKRPLPLLALLFFSLGGAFAALGLSYHLAFLALGICLLFLGALITARAYR
jgi:hypothetical protein